MASMENANKQPYERSSNTQSRRKTTELVEVTKTHMCCGCEFVPADFPDGDLDKPEMLKEDFYDQHIKN